LENTLNPWISARIRQARDAANTVLTIGIILVAIPGFSVLCSFLRPFVPHGMEEFFLHPDFIQETGRSQNHEESHEMGTVASSPEVSLPNSVQSSGHNPLHISDPHLISATK